MSLSYNSDVDQQSSKAGTFYAVLARPASMKEASGTAVVEPRTRPGEMVLLLIGPEYLAVVTYSYCF